MRLTPRASLFLSDWDLEYLHVHNMVSQWRIQNGGGGGGGGGHRGPMNPPPPPPPPPPLELASIPKLFAGDELWIGPHGTVAVRDRDETLIHCEFVVLRRRFQDYPQIDSLHSVLMLPAVSDPSEENSSAVWWWSMHLVLQQLNLCYAVRTRTVGTEMIWLQQVTHWVGM